MRYWKIKYELELFVAADNLQWKGHINQNKTQGIMVRELWYTEHKHTWGNISFLMKVGSVTVIIISIISTIIWTVNELYGGIFDGMYFGSSMIAVIYIRIKTPKFIDSIKIHTELRFITVNIYFIDCFIRIY